MDFLVTVLGILFSFTLIQSLLSLAAGGSKNRKLPPGPAPFPIIGNLNKLGDLPHQSLAELAKTHGPIMSLKLGQITTVVISSSVTAKEVLQKQDLAFSNRAIPDAVHASNHHQHSVIWLPVASRWIYLRKIMNSNIFSGNRLDANQHLRRTKVEELISYCRRSSQRGDAVDIGRAAFRTSLNLLSNTIFSKDMTEPLQDTAKEFKDLVWNIMVEVGKPNLVDFFPLLRKIDPQGIRRRLTGYFEKVLKVFGV
ncbi:unnamed protein product [Ilex paraguariensis]|uniref:Geraniol 8-hydroxylase-like n=1 Tax=Ilex paraguariensis TaxID=185542 RepID=A0ABC8UWK1_9AQUA